MSDAIVMSEKPTMKTRNVLESMGWTFGATLVFLSLMLGGLNQFGGWAWIQPMFCN